MFDDKNIIKQEDKLKHINIATVLHIYFLFLRITIFFLYCKQEFFPQYFWTKILKKSLRI